MKKSKSDVRQLATIEGMGFDHQIYFVPPSHEEIFQQYLQWLFDAYEEGLHWQCKPTQGGTIYTISTPTESQPPRQHYINQLDIVGSDCMEANELDKLAIPEQVDLYNRCVNRASEQIALSVQLWHRIKAAAEFLNGQERKSVNASLDTLYETVKEIVKMERGKK